MAKFNQDFSQFGSAKPVNKGESYHCAQCEAILADALDGILSTTEQAQFDLHIADCATCSQMLADAQRGAAWLKMLKTPRPEPPSALLERILAQTSGQAMPTALSERPVLSGDPAIRSAMVLPFRSRMTATFQPRLAMTAAMAFFSIGLTLNITGVQLNQLHPSDLKPSSVKRGFYQANAHVVRYVDNLRAVYELESRVRNLQRENDDDTPGIEDSSPDKLRENPGSKSPQPTQKQSGPRPDSGTSQRQELANPTRMASFHFAGSGTYLPRTSKDLSFLTALPKGVFV